MSDWLKVRNFRLSRKFLLLLRVLKWFTPFGRRTSLPFLVIRTRLVRLFVVTLLPMLETIGSYPTVSIEFWQSSGRTLYFFIICAVIPRPANLGGLITLYSSVIIAMKSLSFCSAQPLLPFSRPRRRIWIST